MSDEISPSRYLAWLELSCGYRNIRTLPNGRWAATTKFLFTEAIIVGRMGELIEVDDRWCYLTSGDARTAILAWDGNGEPAGWIRHPATGRRVNADGQEEVYA